jgi:hypothetical protein
VSFTKEFEKMETPNEIARKAILDEIKKTLSEYGDSEPKLLKRIYPQGIENLNEEKLKSVLDLCQRSVAKKRADAAQAEKRSDN